MAKKSTKASKERETKVQRCTWSSKDDATLVRILRQVKEGGAQAGAGFKPVHWQAVADALAAEHTLGPPKTSTKCSDHWANLKKNFGEVSAIRNASGFGWDDGTKICTASADVWDRYLKAHPTSSRWRTTPFPLYDDIYFLVNGVVATGERVFVPGRSLSPTETTFSGGSSETESTGAGTSATSLGSDATQSSGSILEDAVANEILSGSDNPDPLRPKTPISRKRTRADSEAEDDSAPVQPKKQGGHRKRRQTQADVFMTGMTDVILQLSQAVNSGNSTGSPERQKKAVKQLFDDSFTLDEQGDLSLLFAERPSYADVFNAIDSEEARLVYGRKLIANASNTANKEN